MEQAASYPVQTLTAAYGLFEAGAFKPGQAVLVHSAAGGVGLQALQILSKCDAAVLGLVGSDTKAQLLQERFAKYAKGRQTTGSQQLAGVQQPETKQQQQQQRQWPYVEFAARQGDSTAVQQQLSRFLSRAGCSGFDVILDSLGPG
jgi:NADPH:quinone reductase-like Zn-dependent oxidoreductase